MPNTNNDPYVIDSPTYMVEGEEYAFKVRIPGATTIADESSALYNNNEDVSDTFMSGTTSSNGVNTITSKVVTGVTGGEIYTLQWSGTVDDKTEIFLLEIRVLHPWGVF